MSTVLSTEEGRQAKETQLQKEYSEENIDYSIKVDEKSDIWISGISEGGTIKDVNAELTLLLINESLA